MQADKGYFSIFIRKNVDFLQDVSWIKMYRVNIWIVRNIFVFYVNLINLPYGKKVKEFYNQFEKDI